MGHPPWATPEQTVFLESFLPTLDEEKHTHSLTATYARVTREFISQWSSPILQIPEKRLAEWLEPKAYADEWRGAVSQYVCVLCEFALTVSGISKLLNGLKSIANALPPLPNRISFLT
jgi:hypothetical protein